MKTFPIMIVFLISLAWLTDASEEFASGKKSKLRRAFFSKRSFPSGYEENPRYHCVISSCSPDPEECAEITRNDFQDEVKREIQEFQCVMHYALCAAKCLKNWKKL